MHAHRRLPRRRFSSLGALIAAVALAPSLAFAAGPKQNLQVELRWVESELSPAAVSGIRDGGTVVSTGGSVSSRGGVTLSTENREQRQQLFPRMLVLNGSQASFTMTETTPVQWVDVAVDRQQGAQDRVVVVPRQGVSERVRGFSVKPNWPGGRSPVNVEVRATDQSQQPQGQYGAQYGTAGIGSAGYGTSTVDPQQRPSTDVLSTVQAPLGVWVTIARTGNAAMPSPRGTYSTRDAEVQRLRDLQLRVDVAP
ncbi:MAG: hypothetical protein J7598_14050 [Mitsuaria chitosanitabida]|uniref:hypothetical protein n=1 Tax=Roseateles chitosanitabidus TaxID=65048 RepID=UPI001B16AE7C|nr:hypothetical protein [Roseateles chitosanitabidus]MBO9687725.1 hypothetical protein [Roseateles chitosanitabidus]